jgi:hypothetical protein
LSTIIFFVAFKTHFCFLHTNPFGHLGGQTCSDDIEDIVLLYR